MHDYDLPVIDVAATGRNILKMRLASGLSVRELQDIFGFSTPQAIYKWQRGEALPTLDNMIILSRIFHTAVENIVAYARGCREYGTDE